MTAVVCVGLATLDSIFAVPGLPEPDGRVVATEHAVAGGGPAATAAVALARLGVETAFVGAVGDDEAGAAIRDGLAAEGVDVTELDVVPGAASPRSTILVDGAERAIVHFPGTAPIRPSDRARALCREAEWVHVDHVGWSAVPDAPRLSVDGGNPIDGLDVAGVALYAPTASSLAAQFGDARGALDAGAELVVVTRGADGSSAYAADGTEVHVPAEPVEPVSTLGAGDVFHGALLAALVGGRALADALAFAGRCAALSTRALDGRSAAPTLEEVA